MRTEFERLLDPKELREKSIQIERSKSLLSKQTNYLTVIFIYLYCIIPLFLCRETERNNN